MPPKVRSRSFCPHQGSGQMSLVQRVKGERVSAVSGNIRVFCGECFLGISPLRHSASQIVHRETFVPTDSKELTLPFDFL
jgi:hypothetical protein